MGYGDALMMAGVAEELYAQDPALGPIAMLEGVGTPRWNQVWLRNPAIWVPNRGAQPPRSLMTGKGYLPYLVNPYSTETGWRFTDWRASEHRGHLFLTEGECALGDQLRSAIGAPYVIIEPTAPRKHINRRPPREFWTTLLGRLWEAIDPPIVQLEYDGADMLPTVIRAPHQTYREACGILARARLLITTEGGLAHAAAALGVPAVVLWGGNVSCHNLGYPEHTNLVDLDAATPCGRLLPCDHCVRAWQRLEPAWVADVVAGVLSPTPVTARLS